jgi:hypothetical protein
MKTLQDICGSDFWMEIGKGKLRRSFFFLEFEFRPEGKLSD